MTPDQRHSGHLSYSVTSSGLGGWTRVLYFSTRPVPSHGAVGDFHVPSVRREGFSRGDTDLAVELSEVGRSEAQGAFAAALGTEPEFADGFGDAAQGQDDGKGKA